MDYLALHDWNYMDFFARPAGSSLHPVVEHVEAYVEARDFAAHPFFEIAQRKREALETWVAQELVMTNAFSQIVMCAASRVRNVHLRAVLAEVAMGEHGRLRNGFARAAHPWLLHELGRSMNLAQEQVRPLPATVAFLERLAATVDTPIRAIAAIGVGNERLIVPEYNAIKRCFESLLPDAKHAPFLNANLNEDILHSQLCYAAASRMIGLGATAEEYYQAAVESIENRWAYFDGLVKICGT